VGVNAGRYLEMGDPARALRILDVDDGRSIRAIHVSDVRVSLVHVDLTATRAVDVAYLS
jgi:hypothetical protein